VQFELIHKWCNKHVNCGGDANTGSALYGSEAITQLLTPLLAYTHAQVGLGGEPL